MFMLILQEELLPFKLLYQVLYRHIMLAVQVLMHWFSNILLLQMIKPRVGITLATSISLNGRNHSRRGNK